MAEHNPPDQPIPESPAIEIIQPSESFELRGSDVTEQPATREIEPIEHVTAGYAVQVAKWVIYIFGGSLIGAFFLVLIFMAFAFRFPATATDHIAPLMGTLLE